MDFKKKKLLLFVVVYKFQQLQVLNLTISVECFSHSINSLSYCILFIKKNIQPGIIVGTLLKKVIKECYSSLSKKC